MKEFILSIEIKVATKVALAKGFGKTVKNLIPYLIEQHIEKEYPSPTDNEKAKVQIKNIGTPYFTLGELEDAGVLPS